MKRQCTFPRELLDPGINDCLKESVNLEDNLVQLPLRQVPNYVGSSASACKTYTYANIKQFKTVKPGISCPASRTEESVVSLANTFKPFKSAANAEQEKGNKLGISCPASRTEESVGPLRNTCQTNPIPSTSQYKTLNPTASGNYAIRCVKSSTLKITNESVQHSPVSLVNLPTSKGAILNPENTKPDSKSVAKVVKVSHIKWHAVKTGMGSSVYSCSWCGQKNIDINLVINHVQKRCMSLSEVNEHEMSEPHTLSSDLAQSAREATKVTLDHFSLESVGVGVAHRKIKEEDTALTRAVGCTNSQVALNDRTELGGSQHVDGSSPSNESVLGAGFDNTSQSEAPSLDAGVADVVSLLKSAEVGTPKRIFKYILRNSSAVSALATQNPEPNVYKCKNCKKVFKSMDRFVRHRDSCNGTGKFLCLICGRSFGLKRGLTKHVETHGLSPATCTVCGETFRNEMMLKTHSMLHTGEHPHKCAICSEGFIFTTSLKKHLREEHNVNEKEFKCKQCSRSFTTERFLAQHQTKEHSGTTKSRRLCPVCGKTSSATGHSAHMASHGPRKHACKLCGYKTYSAPLLNIHILRHKNERNHTCEKCGASFYSRNEMKRHIFSHHTDELPQQCTMCNKAFKFPHRLKTHMILVHRIIPEGKSVLSCEICRQPFIEEYKLKDHMNIHTGARPHACDECGRRFRNLKTLTNHKKIHSKSAKPKNEVSCEICNKTFKTHRTLYYHKQNVHVRGIPFAALVGCDLCDRKFPNMWVLNRHRLGSHLVVGALGEGRPVKPHHECKLCKAGFESQSDLCEHTKTVHVDSEEYNQPDKGGLDEEEIQSVVEDNLDKPSKRRKRVIVNRDTTRPYGCDECDKNYASRIGLYQHRLVHSRRPKVVTGKQYECNHCFKVYSTYGSLYQHRRFTHSTNIKPIPCATCGKTFKYPGSLNAHMQTHMSVSEKQIFRCNFCDRVLKTKKAYNVHIQQHTAMKRWSCDICGDAFARKSECDDHRENVHYGTWPAVQEDSD